MFFNRSQLKLILISCSLILLIGIGGLTIYQSANVEVLVKLYPQWSKDNQKFELVEKKPKNWIRLRNVSKELKWAILVSEDWAFYDHDGLDFQQIERAIKQSIVELRFVRGASTISQQIVKNVFVGSERSLWRKVKEALYTIKLEKLYSKDEILEFYLNIAHLGKDVYGVGDASWYYFKKNPKELNAREGAFLAMLLPSPEKYSQSFRDKKLSDFASEQVSSILIKLRQARVFTEEDRLGAMETRFWWEGSFAPEDDYMQSISY